MEPILFARWDMNILGHFPQVITQRKYVLKIANHFIKWVKVELVASIIEHKVTNFSWEDVITRYRLPQSPIKDNRRQSINKRMQEYCEDLGIFLHNTTVTTP